MPRKNILYVNDPRNPDVEIDILAREGIYCTPVYGLDEAQEALRTKEFDGVLIRSLRIDSGISVPEGYCESGIALARIVKEKGLPLLVLTGTPSEEVLSQLKEIGVDRVVRIPEEVKNWVMAAKEVFGVD
jgi:CheY-like chemotaxis protein